jgi:hypothetical protein
VPPVRLTHDVPPFPVPRVASSSAVTGKHSPSVSVSRSSARRGGSDANSVLNPDVTTLTPSADHCLQWRCLLWFRPRLSTAVHPSWGTAVTPRHDCRLVYPSSQPCLWKGALFCATSPFPFSDPCSLDSRSSLIPTYGSLWLPPLPSTVLR